MMPTRHPAVNTAIAAGLALQLSDDNQEHPFALRSTST